MTHPATSPTTTSPATAGTTTTSPATASTAPPLPALRREVRVPSDPQTAFDLFTGHLGAWWPLAVHSVFGASATVAFEDSRLVERHGAEESVWGEVLDWQPPHRLRITWHPGHSVDTATEVEVTFVADDSADVAGLTTLVTLTHTGWERMSDPTAARDEYGAGWPVVLGRYATRVIAAR